MEPGGMSFRRVVARFQTGDQAVVDVPPVIRRGVGRIEAERFHGVDGGKRPLHLRPAIEAQQDVAAGADERQRRSEEHTSELQSLMRISYAVFCLKKKKTHP